MKLVFIIFGTGFFVLGLLIGNLLAMSAQSLAQALIAALFASFGGSIIVLIEKLSEENQIKVSLAILTISLGTLIGTYSGLYVNEHQLLTPEKLRTNTEKPAATAEVRKYLKENVVSTAAALNVQYRNGMLTAEDAYERLQSLLEKEGCI